ncbi:hypothetical protein AM500_03215 [Bacillus sp. FJAT-18017]|uniref:DUF3238 domain-containing protein n=1 Tax=Bacillus sp. FJAT-18017 TaxID=1705566 RepID=UPI0006AFF537|nr:DUF3238 domain-containing protein [Bacillus sp. FJAT-18017]ALC88919.1 hypothetical protein AM500_03215 [Bacillus sp. FJAT-18017]
MKKIIFSTTCFFLLFLISGSKLYAKENLDVKVKSETSSIRLTWSDVGDYYSVLKPGAKADEVLWSGKENRYLSENLEKNVAYRFTIVAYDNKGKIIELAKVHTFTKNTDSNELENKSMENAVVQSIIYFDRVELSWDKLPDDNLVYDVYRDEELVGENLKKEFIDTKIEPQKRYAYKIIGKKKRDTSELEEIKSKAKKYKIKISPKIEKQLEIKNYEFILNVKTLKPNYKENILGFYNNFNNKKSSTLSKFLERTGFSKTAYAADDPGPQFQPTYALITHTWIPYDFVVAPIYHYSTFLGDSRKDPKIFSVRYRTKMVTTSSFYGGQNIHVKKVRATVSETHGLTYFNRWVSDTASNSGMKIKNILTYDDMVSYQVFHDVANPLVPGAPGIDYYYSAIIDSAGTYIINGYHDNTPSFSIFIADYPGHLYGLVYHSKSNSPVEFVPGLMFTTDFKVSGY